MNSVAAAAHLAFFRRKVHGAAASVADMVLEHALGFGTNTRLVIDRSGACPDIGFIHRCTETIVAITALGAPVCRSGLRLLVLPAVSGRGLSVSLGRRTV